MLCRSCVESREVSSLSDEELRKLYKDEIDAEMKANENLTEIDAINIVRERLNQVYSIAKGRYPYVFLCIAKKSVVAGSDKPTQSITECELYRGR
ncbi:MAG: hypothetical protein QW540_08025 [Archaeoglobaceae archaeon]